MITIFLKNSILCLLTQKSDFKGCFTKQNIQGGFSEMGGVGQFADLREGWQKKSCF